VNSDLMGIQKPWATASR